MVEIVEGKYYRTRAGQKAGPMVWKASVKWYPWVGKVGGYPCYWTTSGSFWIDGENHLDLIAEWSDEPAKPELPKFDVEKLVRAFDREVGWNFTPNEEARRGLLAVANYAAEQVLNPPKDPVEVLAEKLHDLLAVGPGYAAAVDVLARHILETYPDAAEKL